MAENDSIQPGWRQDSLLPSDDWLIPYNENHRELATDVARRLDSGLGFAVVTGIPVASMTIEDAQRFAPLLLSGLGELVRQGKADDFSAYGWLVRAEGFSRFKEGAQFQEGVYTSKTRDYLDLHNDSAMHPHGAEFDIFALLAYRKAKSGGVSILVHSRTVYSILANEYPEQLERLKQPFAFERRHVVDSGLEPVSWGPVFREVSGRLRVRWNRQRIEMAPELTGIALNDHDYDALNALDSVLDRPELRITYLLDDGECLVVDDHEVLHGRTQFEDVEESDRQRCLIRVLLRRQPS